MPDCTSAWVLSFRGALRESGAGSGPGTSALAHLLAAERYREMLAVLTPGQLAVVALILNGDVADYADAGEVLGLGRGVAAMRMENARRRLLARFSDIPAAVAGCDPHIHIVRRSAARGEGHGQYRQPDEQVQEEPCRSKL